MLTVKGYHRKEAGYHPSRGKDSEMMPVALSSCGVKTVSLPASGCGKSPDEAWLVGGGEAT